MGALGSRFTVVPCVRDGRGEHACGDRGLIRELRGENMVHVISKWGFVLRDYLCGVRLCVSPAGKPVDIGICTRRIACCWRKGRPRGCDFSTLAAGAG